MGFVTIFLSELEIVRTIKSQIIPHRNNKQYVKLVEYSEGPKTKRTPNRMEDRTQLTSPR
ncbi:hypothetical protein AHF37_02899 [Paragonimus kellicotti]|nr:hypothetical protein AHF37_02899 [Paragonimus kellicotti]